MLLRTAMCAVFAYFGHYLYTKVRELKMLGLSNLTLQQGNRRVPDLKSVFHTHIFCSEQLAASSNFFCSASIWNTLDKHCKKTSKFWLHPPHPPHFSVYLYV